MIILDTVNRSLQVALAGSVAANQCPVVASWVALTTTASTFVSTAADTVTNNSTAVTIVPAPAANAQQQVKFLSLFNADTAAVTASVIYLDTATSRILVKVTLAVGSTLVYTDGEGFRVIDASGVILGGLPLPTLTSLVASNQATSSTTLVDVPGLSLSLLPNATYLVTAQMSVASSSADGAKYALTLTGSGSPAIEMHITGTLAATSTRTERLSALATATSAFVTVAADGGVTMAGVAVTGTTAGVLTVQQECAVGGTVTVYAKSVISALRIA